MNDGASESMVGGARNMELKGHDSTTGDTIHYRLQLDRQKKCASPADEYVIGHINGDYRADLTIRSSRCVREIAASSRDCS